jgi:hypothetical protein
MNHCDKHALPLWSCPECNSAHPLWQSGYEAGFRDAKRIYNSVELPSAADLDAMAEEDRIKDLTN